MANNNLVIKLSADIAKFQADMRTAASSTQQAMAQMEKDAAMVGRAMGLMAVAGAGALTVMVKQSIDAADKLRDMSQKTAIAVNTLNGMGFAASQAGGSLDGMVSAAGKLNKSIAEGVQGNNDQAAAFKALGINVFDASGRLKTADVVMVEMASKFAGFADGPEKVALSMALMGKAGADMIPVLNEGGAAMQANIEYSKQYSGMTTELANGADNFNDTMGKLQLQQQGFANTLTAAVLPILQAVANETLNAAEQFNGFSVATNAARTVLETFVVVGSEVAFVFKGVGTEIGGMAAQLAALARGDLKGFTAISDAMKEDAARARVEHDKFVAGIMDRTPATVDSWGNEGRRGSSAPAKGRAPRFTGGGGGGGSTGLSDAQKIEQDAQRFIAKLREQAATFGMSGAAVLEYQMSLSKFPQMYKDQALALQQSIDAQTAAAAEDKAFAEATERFMADRERDIARLTSNTPTMVFKAQQDDLATLQDLLAQGVINEQLYAEAVVNRFGLANDKINEGKTLAKDLEYVYTNAFKNMEDSLANFVKTGKLDFSSLANSIIEDMARIAIQQTVTKPLMGALSGFFGFANGGAFGSGGIQAFASGGAFSNSIVSSPTLFKFASGTGLMGEAGPEAIMPLSRGADGKLGVHASGFGGGGGMVVNIIESPGNGGQQSRRTENGVDILDVFVEKVKSAIAGDISRGSGAVPNALAATYSLNRVAGVY